MDRKTGKTKIRIDSTYDMWVLSNLLRKGDFAEGSSFRSVKINNKEEKKPVFIKLEIENIEFSEFKKSLRLNGIIREGSPDEYIQKGKHHALEFNETDTITIEKDWLDFEKDELKKAEKESKKPKAHILLADEGKILIANLSSYGIETNEIEFYTSKKAGKELDETDLHEILKRLDKNLAVIIAGPGFSKFKVEKFLRKNNFKVFVDDASCAEISGIIELVEKGSISKILEEHRLDIENNELSEFEKNLFKETGLAVYGFNHIKEAVEKSAVEKLLILDSLLKSDELRELLKKAESMKVKIVIFSSETPFGKKLKSYTGIAGILRFKI